MEVKDFGATCGGRSPITRMTTSRLLAKRDSRDAAIWETDMTRRAKFEVTAFGLIMIVGMPAAMMAAHLAL